MSEDSIDPLERSRQSYEALKTALDSRDGLLAKITKRENITLIALVLVILVGIVSIILALFQINTVIKQNNDVSRKIQQTTEGPQTGSIANRKFNYLLAQCQLTTNSVADLDKCISSHYKLPYKCGQNRDDNKICVPFVDKPQ